MDNKSFPKAIFLMGPTASGKTNAAVKLLQNFPMEIISVDSALVYQGMDIGTAKPDAETLQAAPHHLINLIPPTEASESVPSQEVPGWIKNNAGWWASGQIDDITYISGIHYLIKVGIIKVS